MNADCKKCRGTGWVCEDHPDMPFGHDDELDCEGDGYPCPDCNAKGEEREEEKDAEDLI